MIIQGDLERNKDKKEEPRVKLRIMNLAGTNSKLLELIKNRLRHTNELMIQPSSKRKGLQDRMLEIVCD